MIPQFTYHVPTKIYYGLGEFERIIERVKEINAGNRVLVVTDQVIRETAFAQKMLDSLKEAGYELSIYDGVEANPAINHVEDGLGLAREFSCDLLIGLGGGSVLDASKAIALMLNNKGSIRDYWGNPPAKRACPVIAVPTTAGTSSEMTWVTVIKDESQKVKMGISHPFLAPVMAIYDPQVTVSIPPGITASTGIDALTHAIEAYINIEQNPTADLAALEAIRLIGHHLRPAVARGENIEARNGMLLATLFAGIAFSNEKLGIVHAITSPLGGFFPVPHGVVNAILLPPSLEFNRDACLDKYIQIAQALGERVEELSRLDAAEQSINAVKRLSQDVGIPERLRDIGVREDSLPAIAEEAIKNVNIAINPRKPTKEDLIDICRKVI